MKGYSEALEYLLSLEKSGIIFGIENIQWILNSIGNPHSSFKSVHIGGTNGKGSVCSMLSCILKEAGYKVGRYTSPHLIDFNERISVNDLVIDDADIQDITDFILNRIDRNRQKRHFSFFDFTTALAFEYFSRKKVDIAVIEVGLGGRLDSTNVISPLLSIITNVEFDHIDYLGNDITKIAGEKSGIIKRQVPVITGADNPAFSIIEKTAEDNLSLLYLLGRDFFYTKQDEQVFSYKGIEKDLENIFLNLKGDYQMFNASLSICAAELLLSRGFEISDDDIYNALSCVKWEGRLETVRDAPVVILDGAHNNHAVKSLSEFIKTHYNKDRKLLIFGVMADKDYKNMLKELACLMDIVILTKPDTQRALSPYKMAGLIENCIVTEDVRSALKKAKMMANESDLILITGSLYTVGEAKKLLDEFF